MKKVIIRVCIFVFILISLLILVGCEERDDLFINGVQYAYDYYSDTYEVREITFWAGLKVEILSEINGKPVTTLDGKSQWLKFPAIVRTVIIPETVTRVEWNFVRYCRKIKFNEDADGYYLGTKDNPYFLFVRPKEDEVIEQYNYVSKIEIESEIKNTPATPPYNNIDSGVVACRINENCKMLIEGAFAGSENLKSITIPGNIKTIPSYAFAECENLETIIVEEGVEVIAYCAIQGCYSLKYIDFPSTVNEVNIFDCRNIENISFAEGTTKLTLNISYCDNLKEIYIPSTVVELTPLIYNCPVLETISVSSDNSHYKSVDGFLYSKDGTVFIRYIFGDDNYPFIKIPEGVKEIAENAFCSDTISIVIPASVVKIGDGNLVDSVYYCGTREMWEDIAKENKNWHVYFNCNYDDYESITKEHP